MQPIFGNAPLFRAVTPGGPPCSTTSSSVSATSPRARRSTSRRWRRLRPLSGRGGRAELRHRAVHEDVRHVAVPVPDRREAGAPAHRLCRRDTRAGRRLPPRRARGRRARPRRTRLRPQYNATYYAAFVIGPDGHNIEVGATPPPDPAVLPAVDGRRAGLSALPVRLRHEHSSPRCLARSRPVAERGRPRRSACGRCGLHLAGRAQAAAGKGARKGLPFRRLPGLLQPDVPLRARDRRSVRCDAGVRNRDRRHPGQRRRHHQVERRRKDRRVQGHASPAQGDQPDSRNAWARRSRQCNRPSEPEPAVLRRPDHAGAAAPRRRAARSRCAATSKAWCAPRSRRTVRPRRW